MSAYIYSGLHTGESEAYQVALSNYLEVFEACPSGDYASTGFYTESEDERVRNIAINPTGSGYNVFNGTTSGTGWYEVRITPSLNPDYSPTVVGAGCTRAEANDNFLLASGEASQGNPDCPICLSSGSSYESGAFQTPIEATYLLDFKWEIELIVHEYDQMSIAPPDNWCADGFGDPECASCNSFAILSGWTTIDSGTATSVEMKPEHSGAMGAYLAAYTGLVPGFTLASLPDVRLGFGDFWGGGEYGDGHDKWELTVQYGNIPTVYNNVSKWVGVNDVTSHYYSGSFENCLEPTNTSVPTVDLVECYAAAQSLDHPSNSFYYMSNTWRFKVTEASVSRQGDNGSNTFSNPDVHHFATSGQFSSPSICDVYKYFHYYDCLDIQSIQSGSSLDNCQVLEAIEAAPESGHRVKMPCISWDLMMTGSHRLGSLTGNPNGTSDDCTVSSLGSGIAVAYVSFGDGVCGALIQRNDDSGNWSGLGTAYSLGTWSGSTYIDNQGCSGCFVLTGSGYKPEPGIFSGCSGYNACVDASGHYAGC
jgi:hypothetical protein